ncbi:hypothetical protein HNO92_002277 [Chromobacterium alkanivorans]|uniref:hypothetical protein n=1 Tax=Chromobacterium alkanivorans TaxID=1071719 RepID=UPI00216755D1|nr:hypothetical protein [Chromobacterium alkanivorans]MCS3804986.1 hypothetical protein [Chromobacterium alkanivorans]MCS3819451.1 hypothetical protein [Chromobacterium alkanivorans]MCS3873963.1 hypothetical protein [Chromobacterium alkanivorans]
MASGAWRGWSWFWGRLGRWWWQGMQAHARRALRDESEALERARAAAGTGGRLCAEPAECGRIKRIFH